MRKDGRFPQFGERASKSKELRSGNVGAVLRKYVTADIDCYQHLSLCCGELTPDICPSTIDTTCHSLSPVSIIQVITDPDMKRNSGASNCGPEVYPGPHVLTQ
jgi:hypothetical protein